MRRATPAQTGGRGRNRCATATRRAIEEAIGRDGDAFDFALFCQWLADRQLGRAAARARERGLEIGFYRDLAVGAAPDGAEAWAHAGALAQGASVGAPPDPFSVQGQNWNLPAPNPLAGAREGWAALSALYAANMRHAGMLRIDHAMGLQRLFLIPDGARPADGAYLAYPLDDLIGHIALESHRARCMVVGEDLGTVPEGFRARLTRANILGMRVLWFERRGAEILPPAAYPPLSVACVATHDLATLAGWWQGADIAEKLSLGLITLRTAGEAVAERLEEKRGLIAALLAAGLIAAAPAEDAPLDDADRRGRPRIDRPLGLAPRQRPVRRPRRGDGGDQPARHRPRAAELAPQARPRRRRGLRRPSGAGDPGGAGPGPDIGFRKSPLSLHWRQVSVCHQRFQELAFRFSVTPKIRLRQRLAPCGAERGSVGTSRRAVGDFVGDSTFSIAWAPNSALFARSAAAAGPALPSTKLRIWAPGPSPKPILAGIPSFVHFCSQRP